MAKRFWRGTDGKLLRVNGVICYSETCPCVVTPPFTPGTDCPTWCTPGTTPASWTVSFAGVADGSCTGHASYYNGSFQFIQNPVTACDFPVSNGSSDTLSGPCFVGVCHLAINATYLEIQISMSGGAQFLRCAHTSGTSCQGPFNFIYDHSVGAPPSSQTLDYSGATAVATAN